MKKFLVIGNPIEHSLSPKIHNYWMSLHNIKAIYEKALLNQNELKEIIKEVTSTGNAGDADEFGAAGQQLVDSGPNMFFGGKGLNDTRKHGFSPRKHEKTRGFSHIVRRCSTT